MRRCGCRSKIIPYTLIILCSYSSRPFLCALAILLYTCNSWVWDCSTISFSSRPEFSSANSSLSVLTEVRVDSWAVSRVCEQVSLIIIFNTSYKHSHLYSTCNLWVWDFNTASSSFRPDFSSASSSLSDFSKVRVDSWTVNWACQLKLIRLDLHMITDHTVYYYGTAYL